MTPNVEMGNRFAKERTLFHKMMSFATKCLENMSLKALGNVELNKNL